jgi:aldehyde dehydrogenase (NAD+)
MPDYTHLSEEVVASAPEIDTLAQVYKNLQDSFSTGVSRTFKARISGLRCLEKLISENYEAISEALRDDLNQADPTPHLQEIQRETQYMISHLSDLMKAKYVSSELSIVNFPGRAELVPEALGVVLIIGTWNYPFHSALGPLAGAIAAGNVVLVKPGSLSRKSSQLIAELIGRYFSPTAVACLEGGKEILQRILDLKWDHIMFTGSPGMGRIVMAAAARHLTSVTLELGGKNPVIVSENSDIDLAARRICWSKFASNAGQVCISCDHLFVHESVADKFLSAMATNLGLFFPKGPENDENYCRIVSKTHTERLKKIISIDKPFIVFGGESDVNAKYISPTLIDFKNDWESFKQSCCMESEIFGPILPIIRYRDIHEVESFLRVRMRQQPPLAFYVFSSESHRALRNKWVSADYPAGAVVINDCGMHIVEDCLPFGGIGTSGIGSYHGKKSFEIFTHYKPVLFKTSWLDISMRYPPLSPFNQRVVRFLLWMGRRNITPLNIGKFVLVVALLWRIMKR